MQAIRLRRILRPPLGQWNLRIRHLASATGRGRSTSNRSMQRRSRRIGALAPVSAQLPDDGAQRGRDGERGGRAAGKRWTRAGGPAGRFSARPHPPLGVGGLRERVPARHRQAYPLVRRLRLDGALLKRYRAVDAAFDRAVPPERRVLRLSAGGPTGSSPPAARCGWPTGPPWRMRCSTTDRLIRRVQEVYDEVSQEFLTEVRPLSRRRSGGLCPPENPTLMRAMAEHATRGAMDTGAALVTSVGLRRAPAAFC